LALGFGLVTHGGLLMAQSVTPQKATADISKCPVMGNPASANRHTVAGALSNRDWWPNQLNLQILAQNSTKTDPMGGDFDYAQEFKKLDLKVLKKDIKELMTTRLVAGRLRHVCSVFYPHGLAQCRHLSRH
jgi:catalase-peroxidase